MHELRAGAGSSLREAATAERPRLEHTSSPNRSSSQLRYEERSETSMGPNRPPAQRKASDQPRSCTRKLLRAELAHACGRASEHVETFVLPPAMGSSRQRRHLHVSRLLSQCQFKSCRSSPAKRRQNPTGLSAAEYPAN